MIDVIIKKYNKRMSEGLENRSEGEVGIHSKCYGLEGDRRCSSTTKRGIIK